MTRGVDTKKLDVFISSDAVEFKKKRRELATLINRIPFLEAIPLEDRGAETVDVLEASLKGVRECDIYLGVFGNDYSETTMEEYREAVALSKSCISAAGRI